MGTLPPAPSLPPSLLHPSGSASPPPPPGLTAKLANYERRDKISLLLSGAAAAVAAAAAVGAGQFMKRQKSSTNLFLSTNWPTDRPTDRVTAINLY